MGEVWAPEPVRKVNTRACRAGQQWQWDGVTFTFLHPDDPDLYWKRNDMSCGLLVEAAGRKILLPGDVESRVESVLADNLPVDFVEFTEAAQQLGLYGLLMNQAPPLLRRA
mgnify:CR=1 FL=1